MKSPSSSVTVEYGFSIHRKLRKETFLMAWKRKPPPDNVRRVVSIGKNIRGVTTNKRGRLVQFESEQERKLILLLERDRTVTDFISQPETLFYQDEDGRGRRYTPDFQVWRLDGRIELHEVTIEQRQQTHDTHSRRAAAAETICRQRGWQYHLHTEQTLPGGQEYANLDFLAPYRAHIYADQESANWWQAILPGRGKIHLREAVGQAPAELSSGVLFNTLYHLLWHDQVGMDWRQPLLWRGTPHPAATIWLSLSATEPKERG
jgi:hypothetical protein